MKFSVDKNNKKITVEREFKTPANLMWAAWTEKDNLDKWWAPKPWKTLTKRLDFSEGGYWLYAMKGPEGGTHWSRADFINIEPENSFTARDSFCDEQGNVTQGSPQSVWKVNFYKLPGSTNLKVEINFDEVTDMEKYLEMGFKEGFTSGLDNLEALIRHEG